MNKKYYYLAGMHRSGNTLLSSILNQNPEIYSGPISPIVEYFWQINKAILNNENNLRLQNNDRSIAMMKKMIPSYYADIKKPIIFDREKSLATPTNLYFLKKNIDPNPKIIFTVRPLLEVLASYVVIFGNRIEDMMLKDRWNMKKFLSVNDNRAEYLMRSGGLIDNNLTSMESILNPENKDIINLVEYENLVKYPQETMNKIYDFIDLPHFFHNFNNIEKIEKDNDTDAGLPADLHKIRPILSKQSKNPEDLFSDYVISRYGNMDFWKNFKQT